MTNFDFPDMQKVRDVESINIWNIGKRLHLPRSLRWRMIKTKSRDNARTPMQWNDSPNAGFTTGTPWLSVNGNYPRINVAEQENAPNSVLAYYRQLIAFRNGSEILQAGDFSGIISQGWSLCLPPQSKCRKHYCCYQPFYKGTTQSRFRHRCPFQLRSAGKSRLPFSL